VSIVLVPAGLADLNLAAVLVGPWPESSLLWGVAFSDV
jgi:hypothetical protein